MCSFAYNFAIAQQQVQFQHAVPNLFVFSDELWFYKGNEIVVLDLLTKEDITQSKSALLRNFKPITANKEELLLVSSDTLLILHSDGSQKAIRIHEKLKEIDLSAFNFLNQIRFLGRDSLLIQGFFAFKKYLSKPKKIDYLYIDTRLTSLPDYQSKNKLSRQLKMISDINAPIYLVDNWKVIQVKDTSTFEIDLSPIEGFRSLGAPVIGPDKALWIWQEYKGLVKITDKVEKRYDFTFNLTKKVGSRALAIAFTDKNDPVICNIKEVVMLKKGTYYVIPIELEDDENILKMNVWKNMLILGTTKGLRMKELH